MLNKSHQGTQVLLRRKGSIPTLAVLLLSFQLYGCNETHAQAAPPPPEAAIQVSTVEVKPIESPRYLRLTGTLRGSVETDLAANVAGQITKIDLERGAKVESGQVVARVDVRAANLALAEASISVQTQQAQLEIDQQECERYEKLRASGVVSEQQYDQVSARCKTTPLGLEAAEARKRIAAKNVGDGVIRAPFAGIVTERKVEVGEYVQASTSVISLSKEGQLRLLFSIPERDIPQVRLGSLVTLKVPAYERTTFTGTVSHLSGAVRATRDMLAEARVENQDGKLLPGMFADVEVQVGSESLPGVPRDALFEQNGKTNLFVVKDGRLHQRIVQALPAIGDLVPLRFGVTAGDKVVSPRGDNLKNGQKVN